MDRLTAPRICRTRVCNGALARAILTGYTFRNIPPLTRNAFFIVPHAPPHGNPVIPFVAARDRNHHPRVYHKVLSALLFAHRS